MFLKEKLQMFSEIRQPDLTDISAVDRSQEQHGLMSISVISVLKHDIYEDV